MGKEIRWDQECNFNPFNKDGSPIPFTKVQQADEYRIHTLAHSLETAAEVIDVVADLIKTRDDCHFDPRFDQLHTHLRLKPFLDYLLTDIWCTRCRRRYYSCTCEPPSTHRRGTVAAEYWEKKVAPENIKPWAEHLSLSWLLHEI
jgi:hypothetical protein